MNENKRLGAFCKQGIIILGSGCGYSGVWLWLFWGLVVVILGSGCGYSGV